MAKQSNKVSKADVSLDDLDQQEYRTGDSLAEGNYPGRFVKFGEPFKLQSQFEPEPKTVFKAYFLVKDDEGRIQATNRLLSVPNRGVIHKMSKLYKTLKALDGGRNVYIDEDGDVVEGFKFSGVEQDPCMVEIKFNKNDFPNVENIAPPVKGADFPSTEEMEQYAEDVRKRREEDLDDDPMGDDIPF